MHEEALRVNRMCPELRKKENIYAVLKHYHDTTVSMYEDIDEEDDFQVNIICNELHINIPSSLRKS